MTEVSDVRVESCSRVLLSDFTGRAGRRMGGVAVAPWVIEAFLARFNQNLLVSASYTGHHLERCS